MNGGAQERDPQLSHLDELSSLAEQAWREGEPERAEETLRNILKESPKHARSLLWLGVLLANTNRLDEGIATLKRLIQVQPESVEGLNWLAAIFREKGLFAAAITYAEQAVEIRPDADGFTNLGHSHFGAEQFEEAALAYRKAIGLQPDSQNYLNLAIALERQGREKDAIWACREGLAHDASHPELNYELGQLLLNTDEDMMAVAHLRVAYTADPNSLKYALALAQALQENNMLNEAEQLSNRVIELHPDNAPVYTNLAAVAQNRGDFEAANQWIDKALALDPDSIGPYYQRVYGNKVTSADSYLVDEMERLLQAGNLNDYQSAVAHYGVGKALNDLGDYSAAMSHFDAANKLSKERLVKSDGEFDRQKCKRSFDRRIEIFNRSFFIRHSKPILETDVPIFVVGMMRSGTTLTAQILSSHPSIKAAGEVFYWGKHAGEALDTTGKDIDGKKAMELGELYMQELHRIVPSSDRIIDKMPGNFRNLGLITTIFPNAKIFHCRRNPADNCLSIYMTPFKNRFDFAHDKDNIAFYYRQYRRLMEHWREVLPPGRMMEIDYEELVADRETVARQMIDFCGLPWDDACLHHETNKRVVHTASKWQARQPIYKSSVERWRRYEPWLGAFQDLLDEYCPEQKAA